VRSRSGERQLKPAWAEKYFDNHAEAFDYFERRQAEHPTGNCCHRVLFELSSFDGR
jgi:hypothetical protein